MRVGYLFKKIVIALLSAVIFSLIMSYIEYTPVPKRDPDIWYTSFYSFVLVFLMFSGPAYLFGVVPISLYIDKYVKREYIKLPLYLFGGFIIGIISSIIFFRSVTSEFWIYGVLGSFASLIFFVLMFLINRLKLPFQ